MLMSLSKSFLFSNEAHLNSGVRLLLEFYCIIVSKHVAFSTICAKLFPAFIFTSFSLNVYTSVSVCGSVVSDLNRKNWRIDGFGERRHGSADLHTLIHPLM